MMQGNFALVTGASQGLGRYFAQALAARKQNVVLVARTESTLAAVAADLETRYQVSAGIVPLDLTQRNAGRNLAEELRRRNLEIDLLVNNAGFGDQGEFGKLTLARQMEMIYLQNPAVVELTYELLPPMIAQRRGGIINVSSMAGLQPIPYATVYSATKSFLTTFSLALEAEVRRYGISVVTICPGRLRADAAGDQGERKKVPGGEQAHEDVVAEALKKLDQGGGLVIPGGMNKFAAFAERFIPRSKVARLVGKLSKPKD